MLKLARRKDALDRLDIGNLPLWQPPSLGLAARSPP
jgi:hypothetical protein